MSDSSSDAAPKGHLHPITQVLHEILPVFQKLGFEVAEGPEIETEFYNFDSLNIPKDHPGRDMQDTFWLKPENLRRLMRTQTSAVQTRFMEKNQPPLRVVVPGRVYRSEATDATHEAQFTQFEALVVDKKVSLAELKGTLEALFKAFLGEGAEVRFRPSYFPFVEPALEVDVKWGDKWLEVLGAGLVHPNVFKSVGIDSDKWQGYAFAFGLDRLAMLKYGIEDIRRFYTSDIRFLNQF